MVCHFSILLACCQRLMPHCRPQIQIQQHRHQQQQHQQQQQQRRRPYRWRSLGDAWCRMVSRYVAMHRGDGGRGWLIVCGSVASSICPCGVMSRLMPLSPPASPRRGIARRPATFADTWHCQASNEVRRQIGPRNLGGGGEQNLKAVAFKDSQRLPRWLRQATVDQCGPAPWPLGHGRISSGGLQPSSRQDFSLDFGNGHSPSGCC